MLTVVYIGLFSTAFCSELFCVVKAGQQVYIFTRKSNETVFFTLENVLLFSNYLFPESAWVFTYYSVVQPNTD